MSNKLPELPRALGVDDTRKVLEEFGTLADEDVRRAFEDVAEYPPATAQIAHAAAILIGLRKHLRSEADSDSDEACLRHYEQTLALVDAVCQVVFLEVYAAGVRETRH